MLITSDHIAGEIAADDKTLNLGSQEHGFHTNQHMTLPTDEKLGRSDLLPSGPLIVEMECMERRYLFWQRGPTPTYQTWAGPGMERREEVRTGAEHRRPPLKMLHGELLLRSVRFT